MYSSELYLDILCIFSYFYIDENCINKSLREIILYLSQNEYRKLKEQIYYNRLYSEDYLENIPKVFGTKSKIAFPTFKNKYDKNNFEKIKLFFESIVVYDDLMNFELISQTDCSEKFYDEKVVFSKRKSGHKGMWFFNRKNNEYIYVIRGTNGSSQWYDNAKVINRKMTASEIEAFEDFYKIFRTIRKSSVTITGHSKGGLTALMIGICLLNKNESEGVKLHTFYAPFVNEKRLEYLVGERLERFMDMILSVEINEFDIVSNLFLFDKLIREYNNKIYFVGEFTQNKFDVGRNHEPLNQIIKNDKNVIDENYDKNGHIIRTSTSKSFGKIFNVLSNLILEYDLTITIPFIIALFRKSGLTQRYNENEILKDFRTNIKQTDDNLKFYFESLKENKTQAFKTYMFFIEIVSNDLLQDAVLEFLEDKEIYGNNILEDFIRIIMKKFIEVFRLIEEKCYFNISYENFEAEKIIDYMTTDVVSVILHEEFKCIFENKNFNKIMKLAIKTFDEESVLYKLLNILFNSHRFICNNTKENDLKYDEKFNNLIYESMQSFFVME